MTYLLMGFAALTGMIQGEVTYYNPGIMEEVLANRLAWGHVEVCEKCIGMIATLEVENIGKHAYITRPGHAVEGPFLVVDVAGALDYARLKRRGLVAEVDWQTAQRWGMRAPLSDVKVFLVEVYRNSP